MLRLVAGLVCSLLIYSQAFALPATQTPASDGLKPLLKLGRAAVPILGKYIVVLDEDTHVDGIISQLPGPVRGQVKRRYNHTIKGFSGTFTDAQLLLIRAIPSVRYIEQDQLVSIDDTQQGAPYNLAITSETGYLAPQDQNVYNYKPRGNNSISIHFVLDTGIQANHPDFAGGYAVQKAANFVDYEPHDDLNGHGTHVAGIINSPTWGVLKTNFLADVKVLDAAGQGQFSTVIAGIDYVSNSQGSSSPPSPGLAPCVINMSLSGGYSQAVNDATNGAVNRYCVVVVAAGNRAQEGLGACDLSPSSASGAITVGAIDSSYNVASFSSEDGCVDIHAPGVDVRSLYKDSSYLTLSGTSMASPHIAGLVGYFVENFGSRNPDDARSRLLQFADNNLIQGDLKGAPNRLGNNGWGDF